MSRPSLPASLIAFVVSAALVTVVVTAAEFAPVDPAPTGDQPAGSETVLHPVVLRRHDPARIATGATDAEGNPLTISCSTCHEMLAPNRSATAADLDTFHQGLQVQHGTNSCLSCHNSDDHYDTLRLADGRAVALDASIELCSQCHGPQRRDFDHGAHGGMTGHWDLRRGERVRNTCISCHDAHVPRYQGAIPVAGPRDRFQLPAHGREGAAHD